MLRRVKVVEDHELPEGCPWAVARQGETVTMIVKASSASRANLRAMRDAAAQMMAPRMPVPRQSSERISVPALVSR